MRVRAHDEQHMLARLRWRALRPGGRVVLYDSSPSRFQFALISVGSWLGSATLLRRNKPDKSDRDQDDACDDQPMWISHLAIPSSPGLSQLSALSSRSFSRVTTIRAAPAERGCAIMAAISGIVCPEADLLDVNPRARSGQARLPKWCNPNE
jgi:hypothetical protein